MYFTCDLHQSKTHRFDRLHDRKKLKRKLLCNFALNYLTHTQPTSKIIYPKMASINPLSEFLKQHQVIGDANYTHVNLGSPPCSYKIESKDKNQLIDLMYESMFQKGESLHLCERLEGTTGLSPIKVDLDFKFYPGENVHKYTLDHIRGIVALYHKAIITYLEVTPEQLKAFVFERETPYIAKGNCKDGLHLMYPYIICTNEIQHLIRNHVLGGCQSFLSLSCLNQPKVIVEVSAVGTCHWLMYGCRKPDGKPYYLTHLFDHELKEINRDQFPNPKTLLRLLSIRDHPVEESIPIKESIWGAEPPMTPQESTPLTSEHLIHEKVNLEEVRCLVRMLGSYRANNPRTWFDVGVCLHTIDLSLLESWISFSRTASQYKENLCESIWPRIITQENDPSLSSLHRWARMDNQSLYDEMMSRWLLPNIRMSQSQTLQDIALVVHDMFQYQFVCVNLRLNDWYEFRNHRWMQIDSGVTLTKKLGNEVVNEYMKAIKYYGELTCHQEGEDKNQSMTLVKNLSDVMYRLNDVSFKEKIMVECQRLFMNHDFLHKLDVNPELIGFENGVYDLSKCEFREGRPEDYISLTTGNEYKIGDDNVIREINHFMTQLFPDQATRDNIWMTLSSFLEGRNHEQLFYIWKGDGSNGKSTLLTLIELAFGRYLMKSPSSMLTQGDFNFNSEVVKLKGIRLLMTHENESDSCLNVGRIKQLVCGDKICCRLLYSDPFDFIPQFKPVFCCNRLPVLSSDDAGTTRRLRIIEFASHFLDVPNPTNPKEFKRDIHLIEKLPQWKESFMFMILEQIKLHKK